MRLNIWYLIHVHVPSNQALIMVIYKLTTDLIPSNQALILVVYKLTAEIVKENDLMTNIQM